MNLYRSKGRHWTGTQADAKEAQGGKDFEHIDVPTDKAGLIAFLNAMEERVGMAGASPDMAEQSPSAFPDSEPNTAEEATPIPVYTSAPAPGNSDDCPACQRSRRVAKMATNSQAAISIMADLEDVNDLTSISRIMDAARARHDALFEAYEPK